MSTSLTVGYSKGIGLFLLLFMAGGFGGLPVAGQNMPTYTCVQRGPHSRVWQASVLQSNGDGTLGTNLSSYTELTTGVCYLDPASGNYLDSVEAIEPTATGGQAVQGPYQVQWAGNANTSGGAVQLTTPNGRVMSSSVYGLSYWDVAAGTNVLIASLQDSIGAIVGLNQVIYTNAFSGLQADIVDTYTLAGFEQNIVLQEQPPSPADFGLDPATTYLQVITLFYEAPDPQITTVETNGITDDEKLNFGEMAMNRGVAFPTSQPGGSRQSVAVYKQWLPLGNGQFALSESTAYASISNILVSLPLHSSVGKPSKKIRRTASIKSLIEKRPAAPNAGARFKEAKVMPERPSFVIDYALTSASLTNFVFQGDTTYLVSGQVDLYGSPIFEGGTVIKYTNSANACLKLLDNHSNFIFKTYPYRPAVFTSMNDNNVGSPVSGSTGAPTNGPATYLSVMNTGNTNVLIQHARFSYACIAFWSQNDYSHIFRDCQWVQCSTNVALSSDWDVEFANVLSAKCKTMLMGYGINVEAENMTVDGCNTFAFTDPGGLWGDYFGGITNSIITPADASVRSLVMTDTLTNINGTGIYQTTGAGHYYLAAGSPYRNAGTTNIDPILLADLRSSTTYPPLILSNMVMTNDKTLFPQAQRDTDAIDLGYHYDPFDFAMGDVTLTNATLSVLPGTAIAGFNTGAYGYALGVGDGGTVKSFGTATSPIYFASYHAVQEGNPDGWTEAILLEPNTYNGVPIPTANFRFTYWSTLAGGSDFEQDSWDVLNPIGFQDCRFFDGQLMEDMVSFAVTNCLFQRTAISLSDYWFGYPETHLFYNSLFVGGTLQVQHDTSGLWSFYDNVFDQTSITQDNPMEVCSNNACLSGFGALLPDNGGYTLAQSPAYESGGLGDNYYPSTSYLTHTGCETAPEAGLYHYTVVTNNVIEGTNIVAIGFHYVALGGNGLPLDSNSDGIPDYLEDANGNGVVDSGEINWQVPGDPGLTVAIIRPANNSEIP